MQVKTCTLRNRKQGIGYFLTLGWGQAGSKQRAVRRPRTYTEEIDVMVIWGVDENRFWIVPAKFCDGCQSLLIRPTRTSPMINRPGFTQTVYSYENRWDLLVPSLERSDK